MTSSARPLLNRRLAEFGTTIFAEMSALALRTGSINLGQGFPDTDGPEEIRRPPYAPCATAAATSTRRAPASPNSARPSPPTSNAVTASRTTPTPRSWSPPAPRRPSPPHCSPCWSPATR
ncbi:hypothetical protein SHKM778_02270 [Streptomyces sp. KM77-8]|uniref:Uncharacterized protein n=1 Tax=Streptomyces haneummycinicus TaxID=3074435 RepID=A0AAT9H954_9ACTN